MVEGVGLTARPGYMEYMACSRPSFVFTEQVNQRIGAALAPVLAALRLSPNSVTLLGAAFQIGPAIGLAVAGASLGWMTSIGLAVLWQIGYALDCADGQIARVHGLSSSFGGWLDQVVDFVNKSFVVTATVLYVVRLTDAGPTLAVALLAFALCPNLLLLLASSLKGTLVGSEPAIRSGAGPVWMIAKHAKHAADYGIYLLVTALLLPVPEAEMVFQIVFGGIQLAAVGGLAAALRKKRVAQP